MKLAALLATACLLASNTVHAGVIYEWRPLNDAIPRDITLRLEFTPQTVESGAFAFQLPYRDPAPSYPDLGLVSLYYAFPGMGQPMSYRPPEEQFRFGLGALDMSVRFEPGGLLSGWIRANDQHSSFEMRSDGTLFTILDARSDESMWSSGCDRAQQNACSGAAGELRQVPEPHGLALLALGALGAWGARRRRR